MVVPSDGGGCLSGSDCEDFDWSIGWPEPHDPYFFGKGGDCQSEVQTSFAVLVPCYGRRDRPREGIPSGNHLCRAVDLSSGILPDEFTRRNPFSFTKDLGPFDVLFCRKNSVSGAAAFHAPERVRDRSST